ncbi:glutamate receptor 2.5-like isoform X2 [Impatiens glandulifera]|nr:glutamate receptor 2.5-like isoform X2 [Impatiens glandulifera]
MAIDDFFTQTNKSLVLRVESSPNDPLQATLAARNLMDVQHVEVILGPQTWEEVSLVAELGERSHIPILSFSDFTPTWATERWSFLLQFSPSQSIQIKALAAIVSSWGWRRVNVIYEDMDSSVYGITPHLLDAFQKSGVEIGHLVPLPRFVSGISLMEILGNLKTDQCRVFVIHTSLPLSIRLFEVAKKMDMMTTDYVWITTTSTTSLVHSLNSSVMSSMQGVIGVNSYFPEMGPSYHDFYDRFYNKFGLEHVEEKNHEPGIYALRAYDATWILAQAMNMDRNKDRDNQGFIDRIFSTNSDGLSGKIHFVEKKPPPSHLFQIINIHGRSYKELGYWSESFGFSRSVDGRVNSSSMNILGTVIWPGGSHSIPKGWSLPTSFKPWRIAVPNTTLFKLFETISYDPFQNKYRVSGLSVDLFKAAVDRLPYYFPCDYVPFTGTFDALLEQVHLKNFDAAIGLIAITSKRYEKVDFTQTGLTEAGLLVMVVPVQIQSSNQAWLFVKPFTKAMWLLTAGINLYNGFVVWVIERDHIPEFKGSGLSQVGSLIWLSFSTLFSLRGAQLHNDLSRMAVVVWLFMALVVMQTYTANLTSMLTVPRLKPTITDIETLKYSRAMIGCTGQTFVPLYLSDVLQFNPSNIKANYTSLDEIARALNTKEIEAAFLQSPLAKQFLARYCKSFTLAGPTFAGGYGFAFQKGSPVLPDINTALIQVIETGKFQELENSLISAEMCVEGNTGSKDDDISISANSFQGLFMITVGASTISLLIHLITSCKLSGWMVKFSKSEWLACIRRRSQFWSREDKASRVSDSVEENSKDLAIQVGVLLSGSKDVNVSIKCVNN